MRSMIRSYPVISFFVLTFAFTWVLWGLVIVLHLPMSAGYVPFLMGASGPSLVAFLITGITGGRQAVNSLWGRIKYWRVGLAWILVALFLPTVMVLGGIGLNLLFSGALPDFKLLKGEWFLIPVALITGMLLGGPLEEEFGWRGFALVNLQKKYNALIASLMVGFFWGIWHLPAFLIPWSTQHDIPVFLFLLHDLALAILFTWIFNNTGGSILMAMLAHAAFNLTITILPVLPSVAGSVLPLEYTIAVMYGMVIIIILIFGPKTLTREASETP